MNNTQQYHLLSQAKEQMEIARESAWKLIQTIADPENDDMSDNYKFKQADKSLSDLEYAINDARDCLEGVLLPESLSLSDVFGEEGNAD